MVSTQEELVLRKLSDKLLIGELERAKLNEIWKSCQIFWDDVIVTQKPLWVHRLDQNFFYVCQKNSKDFRIDKKCYFRESNSKIFFIINENIRMFPEDFISITRKYAEYELSKDYYSQHMVYFSNEEEFFQYLSIRNAVTWKKQMFRNSQFEVLFNEIIFRSLDKYKYGKKEISI